MKKILSIGSCRVKSSVDFLSKEYKVYKFAPHMHTLEQIIQFFNLWDSESFNHYDLFSPNYKQIYRIFNKKNNVIMDNFDLTQIDAFIIEIPGVRNYLCKHGLYLHPFPRKYRHHEEEDYKITYTNEINKKMKELISKLNRTPTIIISNHNIYNKDSRTNLISKLNKVCRLYKNVRFVDPTDLIDKNNIEKYLKNENHYKRYTKQLLSKRINEEIKSL